MSHVDDALACFAEGFNCAQAVFATYGPLYGMDRTDCLKISGAFGGGMGRCGEACGAVTGAIMVIGLLNGQTDPADRASKDHCYRLVRDLVARFRDRHGSINCTELLRADLGTRDGLAQATARKAHTDICPAFVRSAAEILEAMLNEP